jgi:UDP:flavonoid glycosyltransferase YjiC (YdhE family)
MGAGVRVVLSTTAGVGHFAPMVPVAHALLDAGHDVRVAAPGSFADTIERAGLMHAPFGDAPPEDLGAVFSQLPDLPRIEANRLVIQEVFGRIDTRSALDGVRAIFDGWRPDAVVREPAELASYVVAEEMGLPHVQVAIGLRALEEFFIPLLDEPLREHGCARGSAGLTATPRLTSVPERLDPPGLSDGAATHRFSGFEVARSTAPLPDWWEDNGQPLVYVSFGSVAGSLPTFRGLYGNVVAALADLPIRVLLTVGEGVDPDALRPLPPKVHVERWWPQEAVMPHASAMVGHGGFGTTMQGLAAGVPMVVLPLFASDQFLNAERVDEIGAGIALEGTDAIDSLDAALRAILGDPTYGEAAGQVAADMAALPPASACAPIIEAAVANDAAGSG